MPFKASIVTNIDVSLVSIVKSFILYQITIHYGFGARSGTIAVSNVAAAVVW